MWYNEIDPFAADWLEELASRNLIAPGPVDRRPIQRLDPGDCDGRRQQHFFAGIGAWSYALRLAGIPDDAAVWTGSCPCQPFSVAGRQRGEADERHLWPIWRDLIAECRPPVVFGEQVASKAGRSWLAAVRAEMEALGYAVGAADLCAAGVGAPHIRQRLYFGAVRLADAGCAVRRAWDQSCEKGKQHVLRQDRQKSPTRSTQRRKDGPGRLADAGRDERFEGRSGQADGGPQEPSGRGDAGRLGDPPEGRLEGRHDGGEAGEEYAAGAGNPWGSCDWIPCSDGKYRPTEPGTFPLAHGAPARVGRLRGYGNAIIPQVAAAFIQTLIPRTPRD